MLIGGKIFDEIFLYNSISCGQSDDTIAVRELEVRLYEIMNGITKPEIEIGIDTGVRLQTSHAFVVDVPLA